ncbi:RDD family protein [Lutibacter sp. TH_r2]|uniref:RDD family protein n=1 Tax=Lutibacter sp. TH_r2 TaxID=3082083 RepID=UPI0029556DBD|nr:RDD family protein [Lutibacter sp. TH_r2]MDV7188143.1 RDD family protein [Lutibacter sp. TH_r2]
MDNFHIETAQNVTIQQNVASLSLRIGAFVIDMLFIGAYYIIIFFMMSWLDFLGERELMVAWVLFGLPTFFYSLLFEVFMNGQTPGKYFNQIRVTKIDGSKPTFGSFLIRWVLRIIDISLSSGSIAILTILLNGKGQRLGDIAAGTTIISERKKVTINQTLNVDIPEEYKPTFPQVTLLSDMDIQTIKELYFKAKRRGNHQTIVKLHAKVIELTGITTEMKPVDFVGVIIKDYNYYTQQM